MNIEGKQIIFIGPVGVGKSTLGKLVAEGLNKESISLDEIAVNYYEANGFSFSEFREIELNRGKLVAYQYWWPSLAYAAKKVVQDYPNCVVDFGAGHSHYESNDLFETVKQSIPRESYVIFLLPSPDIDKSVSIIREKCLKYLKTDWKYGDYDFIEHWIKDKCNHILADKIIYTENKTPMESRDEILELFGYTTPKTK